MAFAEVVFLIAGMVPGAFFALFALTSWREKKPRAAAVSAGLIVVLAGVWLVLYVLSPTAESLFIPAAMLLIVIVLFFAPLGRTSGLEIGEINERFDERDVVFAREEYLPGTATYTAYYARRPEKREIDDKIRSLPELLAPGGRYYDPVRSPYTEAIFKVIEQLTTEVDGPVHGTPAQVSPEEMTTRIKEITCHLGAAEVGVARLDPMFVYSHVGRGPEPWGTPITTTHRFAIAFSLEMAYTHVEAAPRLPITEESARQYLREAVIAIALAHYIRDLGYPARAHISGSNYQVILPPVAHAAGLGELGRHGYLISATFGSRVRLGAVTTDLPLVPDRPIMFGVQEFCETCLRCADNCPSAAIPDGPKTNIREVVKWPLDAESCLRYWRSIGTDCGLCMKVCPYSHPRSPVHSLVRAGIRRSALARLISVHGENIFYGKKARF